MFEGSLLMLGVLMLVVAPASFGAQSRPYGGVSFGPEGQGSTTNFQHPGPIAADPISGTVYVADTAAGSVYKFDEDGDPEDFSALGASVISGLTFVGSNEAQLAVGPTNHELYVLTNDNGGAGSLKAYDAGGEPAEFSALGSPEIRADPGSEFCGVAVDGNGYIYVGDYYHGISIFSPTGEAIVTVPVATPCNVAVDGAGDIYVNHWTEGVERLVPSEFPPTAGTSYASTGMLGGAHASSVYADSSAGPVLIDEESVIAEFAPGGSALGRFAESADGEITASEGVAYGPGAGRAYASDSASGRVKIFSAPEPSKPDVISERVSSVGSTEATLVAAVDPEGFATTVFFEYGQEPCAVGHCAITASVMIGAGEAPVPVTQIVRGLGSGSRFFYRAVAESVAGTSSGSDRSFETEAGLGSTTGGCPNEATRNDLSRGLPDCRAFEMVSPVDKEGNDIRALPEVSGLQTAIDQLSSARDQFTFSTFGAFAGASSGPYVSQYLATRGAGGWSTQNLTPPREGADEQLANEFKLFSPDLSASWVVHSAGPSLAPGGPAAGPTLYERQTATGTYSAINTTADEGFELEKRYPIQIQGEADGHTVFRVPVDGPGEYRVFDRVAGSTREVSVLPGGSPYPGPATVGAFGRSGEGGPTSLLDHAVSEDGSHVYWTGLQELFAASGPIYLRVDDQETRAVSETVSSADARFWTASSDGSRALFSFTEGAVRGGLYEYSEASGESRRICGELVGVVGGAEDLSRFYFVSLESIGGEGVGGTPNLYVSEGGQIKFVAGLSLKDISETPRIPALTSRFPVAHSAAVSADGEVVVFNSLAEPTGYDNRDRRSGEPDNEVYRFDAATSQLTCISCQPTGAQPEGQEIVPAEGVAIGLWSAAQVPVWQTPFHEPHVIAAGGDRIFFDAYAPILARDGNGKEDVYEWEAVGTGTCSPGSPDYFPRDEGCLSLISTGTDPLASEFLDASPEGRDAFFSTGQSLVDSDPGFIDIYDAREFGGFAETPAALPGCEGDACQGGESTSDRMPAAGTSTFVGPKNAVKPRRKHRRKQKGHHHKKQRHRHQSKRQHLAHRGGKDSK
jgi:hypothetical protein